MIVETVVFGIIVINAVKCLGFGLGTVAKAAGTARLLDGRRKHVTIPVADGQTAKISVDEFVDPKSGEKRLDFAVLTTDDGKSVVLTKSEMEMLQAMAIAQGLLESNLTMSSSGWRAAMKPLMDAIKRRQEEIKQSPTRQTKLRGRKKPQKEKKTAMRVAVKRRRAA